MAYQTEHVPNLTSKDPENACFFPYFEDNDGICAEVPSSFVPDTCQVAAHASQEALAHVLSQSSGTIEVPDAGIISSLPDQLLSESLFSDEIQSWPNFNEVSLFDVEPFLSSGLFDSSFLPGGEVAPLPSASHAVSESSPVPEQLPFVQVESSSILPPAVAPSSSPAPCKRRPEPAALVLRASSAQDFKITKSGMSSQQCAKTIKSAQGAQLPADIVEKPMSIVERRRLIKQLNLTPEQEEALKYERKKARNRESAKNCRSRNKNAIVGLAEQVTLLQQENERQAQRIKELLAQLEEKERLLHAISAQILC